MIIIIIIIINMIIIICVHLLNNHVYNYIKHEAYHRYYKMNKLNKKLKLNTNVYYIVT